VSRVWLLKAVDRYRSRFPEELEVITAFEGFVRAHEQCFERTFAQGHVTGSAWILDQAHGHCLLTHHQKLQRWFQLGGHADGDSNIVRVAMREAQEESGLSSLRLVSTEIFDLDIHLIPERRGEAAHHHFDVRFLFEGDRNEALSVSEESLDLAWVSLADIGDYTDEDSMHRMVQKTG
jgi:8-oxo-dGTP pyrophosphatase MutT (NUDIX family)